VGKTLSCSSLRACSSHSYSHNFILIIPSKISFGEIFAYNKLHLLHLKNERIKSGTNTLINIAGLSLNGTVDELFRDDSKQRKTFMDSMGSKKKVILHNNRNIN
jgi:hypothetical protein